MLLDLPINPVGQIMMDILRGKYDPKTATLYENIRVANLIEERNKLY